MVYLAKHHTQRVDEHKDHTTCAPATVLEGEVWLVRAGARTHRSAGCGTRGCWGAGWARWRIGPYGRRAVEGGSGIPHRSHSAQSRSHRTPHRRADRSPPRACRRAHPRQLASPDPAAAVRTVHMRSRAYQTGTAVARTPPPPRTCSRTPVWVSAISKEVNGEYEMQRRIRLSSSDAMQCVQADTRERNYPRGFFTRIAPHPL